jgi:hypothetical protein
VRVVMVRFGFSCLRLVIVCMTMTMTMIVIVIAVIRCRVLVIVLPGLSVGETHAVSLGPRLHLDKTNFTLTTSADKGNLSGVCALDRCPVGPVANLLLAWLKQRTMPAP